MLGKEVVSRALAGTAVVALVCILAASPALAGKKRSGPFFVNGVRCGTLVRERGTWRLEGCTFKPRPTPSPRVTPRLTPSRPTPSPNPCQRREPGWCYHWQLDGCVRHKACPR